MTTRRPQRDRQGERNAGVVSVRLIGQPEVQLDGARVALGRKAVAILGLITLERAQQSREKLAAMLWPDSSEASSRSALRNALVELRRALGDALVADRHAISIARSPRVVIDVDLVADAVANESRSVGTLEAAADACRGELMEGVSGGHASELDDWLVIRREVHRRHASALFGRLVELRASAGRFADAIDIATRRIAFDRLGEDAYRDLIALQSRAGERDAAMRTYETLRELLQRELGAQPSAATKALAADVLREAPSARVASSASPPKLVAPPTELIGREDDLRMLEPLVTAPSIRVLTVVGPGGVGKTRLALELVSRVGASFASPPTFVSLAPMDHAEQVLPAIARALDAELGAQPSTVDAIAAAVAGQRRLLALDNFEHVIDAAADVSALVASCTTLTVLTTSRAALRIRGEHIVAIAPLTLAPHEASDEERARAPAVRLFVDRAREAGHRVQADELAIVAEICARLDGLPLAIELAAARTRLFSCTTLLERLATRLPVLTGGPRDLPARQRTLRDTIRWSCDLLSPDACAAFRRLAVFSGPFSIEAAEHVTGASLDAITEVADQSLAGRSADGAHLVLLETVRELASEQLDAADERDAMEQRHARWYLTTVERAIPDIHGARQSQVLASLAAEHHNLHRALDHALATPNLAPIAVALVGRLAWYWHLRGYWREGRVYARAALARAHDADADPVAHGRALYGAGLLACAQEDFDDAVRDLDRAIALLPASAGLHDRAHALGFRAAAGIYRREPEGLDALLDESLALFRQAGDPFGSALALLRLGIVAAMKDDWPASVRWCEQSASAFETLGNAWGIGMALSNLGEAWLGAGEATRAHDAYRRSFEHLQRAGSRWYLAIQALGWAGVLAHVGRAELGARLLGAADDSIRSAGSKVPPMDRHIRARSLSAIEARLDPDSLERARDAGVLAGLDDLVREAHALVVT